MDMLTYTCIFVSFTFSEGLQLLDSNILRFEPVYYNKQSLQSQHDQLQHASSTLYLNFYAYNRNFSLHLTRDRDPLTTNFDLRHKKKSTKVDLSFIYSGSDEEYPGSIVEGAIIDGIFQGTIRLTGDTIYHVVPSHKVFVELPPFHSVIYSEHDYKWDAVYQHLKNHGQKMENSNSKTGRSRHRRAVPAGEDPSLSNKICTLKLTSDHRIWSYLMGINNQNEDRTKNDIIFMFKSHVTELNYIYGHTVFTLNKGKEDEKKFSGVQFVIRAVDILTEADCMSDGRPTLDGICGINLPPDGQDGLLYRFADREFNSLYGGDEDYGTDYGEEYNYDDYGKDTEYTDDIDYNTDPVVVNGTEPVSVYNTTNNTDDEYPVYHYDNEESNDRPVGYCLSFLFTARILFSNGNPILGLSFAATPGQSGGVCQKDANNGFVTMFQYTDRAFLPSLVTKLVFAHEVSHAFGALHDNAKKCSPYNLKTEPEEGYYLMYSIAQRGVNPNNKLLSNCSVDTISAILSLPEYRQCFEETAVPFCGNSIVEKGEECDCGMNSTCTDICCNGKGHNPDRPDLDCKLKPKAQCSSSQGPCCDGHTCQLINRNESFVCQNEMPCVKKLYCNGDVFGAACPEPEADQVSEDGFVCSANGRVCEAGSCNASICKMIGWRECQQSDSRDKLTISEKEELCYVGCKKTKKSECISTHDYEKVQLYPELAMLLANVTEIIKHTKVAIQLPIGTPCNKMTGYCDVFHRCRGVNPDTVLVRIKNCIVGGQCMMQLKEFAQTYWWAILLVSVGSIFFFVIFVKLCAIHTKSSNPEVELRNPRQTVRQSLKRVSNLRESVNMTNIRNSMNFSNFRQSFRGSFRRSSRPTSNEVDLKNMIKVDPDELQPLDPPLKNGT